MLVTQFEKQIKHNIIIFYKISVLCFVQFNSSDLPKRKKLWSTISTSSFLAGSA